MKRSFLRRFCRLAFVLSLAWGSAQAHAQEEEWIKFSSALTKDQVRPGESVIAEIFMDISKGYHLTKEQTSLSVSEAPDIQVGEITYPKAEQQMVPALGEVAEIYGGKAAFALPLHIENAASPGEREIKVNIAYQGCSEKVCFLPAEKEITLRLTILPAEAPAAALVVSPPSEKPAPEAEASLKGKFSEAMGRKNYLLAILIAFIAGIGLSLTPCVYPMIPITVGVIGAGAGQKQSRGFVLSLFYVLGIASMFSILGLVAASTGGVFGAAAGSPKFIAPLTALFAILAFGMMGAFELQLPPAIAEKFGGKKFAGVTGVFLMGFLAGIIVSPCGAPVLAIILLHVAKTGDKLIGFLMLFFMAWGLGLLFIIIGTFSGVLAALPKSGGWMEVVKKTMGVVMMGAALYYAKILLRPEALAPAVAVAMILSGIYLSDFLKHGFAAPRGLLALGMLTIVGGILAAVWIGIPEVTQASVQTANASPIPWLHSETDAESRAITEKKPIVIDAYAQWCAQCKRLDRETFSHPSVVEEAKRFVPLKLDFTQSTPEIETLKQKYEIVSLPTIIFIDSNGDIQGQETIRGFVTPEEMLEAMKHIR